MFNFIKDKLKSVISKFSKKVEEEAKEVKVEEGIKAEECKKEELKEEKIGVREERKKETPKERAEEKKEEVIEKREEIKEAEKIKKEIKEEIREEEEPKTRIGRVEERAEEERPRRGFFEILKEKITKKVISEEQFEELFYDLELALLENNVAVEVIEKIKEDLKKNLVGVPLDRSGISERVKKSLRKSIEELFDVEKIDILKKVHDKKPKPFVMVFVGINGSGKTTTIAKVANLLIDKKMRCVFAASDTFRAASQEQLEEHANRLNVRVIKHHYGADPAAVAFDAIKYGQAHGIDVVLVDTAGRLHSNVNLMDEMKKIVRVAKPDLIIFVGEAITGNDCVEQAKRFNETIGIDGIILAKADVDEKGGAAVSVSYVTQKPIIYLGTGQEYSNLEEFKPEIVVKGLGLA